MFPFFFGTKFSSEMHVNKIADHILQRHEKYETSFMIYLYESFDVITSSRK